MGKKNRVMLLLAAFCLILAGALYGAAGDGWTTKVHTEQGGDALPVESGGAITVKSGGSQDFEGGASLKIGGVQVTSSAAELNFLDGPTAGVATAGKAAVLGASKNVDVLRVDSGLTVGSGGTQIDQIKMYTINAWDIDSVAADTALEQTVAVSGLTTADFVFINPWTALETGLAIGSVRVSAPDTLAVQFVNVTAGAINQTARQFDIVVFRKH